MLNAFNENFQQFGFFESRYSVDEKIVQYFGKHPMKQFIRGKPIRFGFKELALCDVTGYIFKFEVYQGKEAEIQRGEIQNINLGARVVLKMTESCPRGNEIYFDNFVTHLSLINALTSLDHKAIVTVRCN